MGGKVYLRNLEWESDLGDGWKFGVRYENMNLGGGESV